jgi:hypothetical protein
MPSSFVARDLRPGVVCREGDAAVPMTFSVQISLKRSWSITVFKWSALTSDVHGLSNRGSYAEPSPRTRQAFDQSADEIPAGFELVEGNEFVGLVGLIDIAWPVDNR